MNRAEIEYVINPDGTRGWTWNPLTGCLTGCLYCYARRIARRYGKTEEERAFRPVFHPERLTEPQRIKKPSTIFVCSMADLFGDWIPAGWIATILDACRNAPQHLYLFLTKNPKRYSQYWIWPEKCMVGETLTMGKARCFGHHHNLRNNNRRIYLSIEPLLESISVCACWDWVIVGAMTGPGAVKPEVEWVQDIVEQCKNSGIPLFMKNNLKDIWPGELIQEIPWIIHK